MNLTSYWGYRQLEYNTIARSRLSSKVIFAETFSVGRGVVDISVTSDASKEIINVGNEILRNF